MKKTQQQQGDSCAGLSERVEKLEKAFRDLSGMTLAEYEASKTDDPVVEEKRFDRSVIKMHRSGAIENLRICQYCGAEVTDLATHQTHCSKRPVY
ncbi:MAG: hypothetical protein WC551_08240 [Patescibacteria group bacterium]